MAEKPEHYRRKLINQAYKTPKTEASNNPLTAVQMKL